MYCEGIDGGFIQEAYLHLSKAYLEDKFLEVVPFILFLPFPAHC